MKNKEMQEGIENEGERMPKTYHFSATVLISNV
jgi:hypothetical protein